MDEKAKLTLDAVLEEAGLTAKWEKRGEARGVAIGKKTGLEEAIALLKQGYTVDELERMSLGGSPNPAL